MVMFCKCLPISQFFIRPTILTKDNIDDISRQKYSYIQAKRITIISASSLSKVTMEGVDKILALPKLFSALITIPNALVILPFAS
jgi:hypothetical protein